MMVVFYRIARFFGLTFGTKYQGWDSIRIRICLDISDFGIRPDPNLSPIIR